MTGVAVGVSAPKHQHGSLQSYLACLRDNPAFCWLWLAECVNNIGSWFNYVATLDQVDKFSNGSGLALAAVVVLHFLPSLLLAPLAGVVADRYNRVKILLATSLIDCVLVASMVTVTSPSDSTLLYLLLLLQFSCLAFYTPARSALLPLSVSPNDLPAAATIDSFAWSLTGAVASSLGGFVASRFGVRACFLLDAVTYALSALCTLRVPLALGAPDADPHGDRGQDDNAPLELSTSHISRSGPLHGLPPPASLASLRLSSALPGSSFKTRRSPLRDRVRTQMGAAWSSVVEGFTYLAAPENRDVAGILTLKGAGCLSWGSIDILNARFSEMPVMQRLGDGPTTMGIIFGVVGVGATVGPLVLNPWVPPQLPSLLAACALSLSLLSISYALMSMASGIMLVLLATGIRSIGSSTLWVFSSLALQLRVPGTLLGRLSAWEMAVFTVSESAGGLGTGLALDLARASLRDVLLVVLGVSCIPTLAWLAWAAVGPRRAALAPPRPGPAYVLVDGEADAGPGLDKPAGSLEMRGVRQETGM